MTITRIDPNVKYRTVAALKRLLLPDLEAALGSPIVIQDAQGEALAVLVPMEDFLAMQDAASGAGEYLAFKASKE